MHHIFWTDVLMYFYLALIGAGSVYLAWLWRQGSKAKRAALNAKRIYAAMQERRPYLCDSQLSFADFRRLSLRNREAVKQSLWLNLIAMDEHKKLWPNYKLARRLQIAAGLGGPAWSNPLQSSLRTTPV